MESSRRNNKSLKCATIGATSLGRPPASSGWRSSMERWLISCESRLMEASPERTPEISTQANTETSATWLMTMVQKMSCSSQASRLILRVITHVAEISSSTRTTTAGNRRRTRRRASEPGGIQAFLNLSSTFGIKQIAEAAYRLYTGARAFQPLAQAIHVDLDGVLAEVGIPGR